MRVTTITICKDIILLDISGAAEGATCEVVARVPVVCGDPSAPFTPGRIVASHKAVLHGGRLTFPRRAGDYDMLICAFEVSSAGCLLEGVRYATEIDPDVAEFDYPYPQCSIKALNCAISGEEADTLHIGQTSAGPNQAELMAMHPSDNTITYIYNGVPYYFKKDVVEAMDAALVPLAQRGIPAVMRYVNGSFLLGEKADPEIVEIIQHPAYDYDFPAAYIGAFNVRTEQGLDYYCACTEFLAERYSRPDRKYGWCLSYEVGNEVTSQYIWNNAGEMTCDQFMLEYTTVMRLAWLLARKHYAGFRIFTSFDQYFSGRHVPEQPKRYYGMKESIDCIAKHCARDGDFPWNIATHPYPENLNYPDFYHDREPNFTFATRRITFKNIEVMPAYLAQERLLYKGQPRRIIFPEQGFNSRDGEPYTELEGAHGYCLAYLKIRRQPTIEMFLHHSYIDNPWEFGLNLGVRRFGGLDEHGRSIPGEPKPVYYVMRDMDTPAEAQRIAEARAFIGPLLFDRLLNPPAVTADLDRSREGLSIPGQGHGKRKGKPADSSDETVTKNFDT
ncbi:MAG: DUF5722 domain-containing protein [Chloroflexi bacterium]|nr:DUF5722 domain-containing protein [Chloroflexota bacterium]